MSLRRKKEANQLRLDEDERLILSENEQLIKNCAGFIQTRYGKLQSLNLREVGTTLWMVEFSPDTDGRLVREAFDDWNDWYGSDARQLICQFETMRREYDNVHSPSPGVLCLTTVTIADFKKCEQKHWEAENWEIDETLTDQITYGSCQQLLDALTIIFKGQGIIEIRVLETGPMRIVPIDEYEHPASD